MICVVSVMLDIVPKLSKLQAVTYGQTQNLLKTTVNPRYGNAE